MNRAMAAAAGWMALTLASPAGGRGIQGEEKGERGGIGAPLFQSGDSKTVLIELFTSEGCSSCPPAEEWFGRLRRDPGLWKAFVPVSFHVDYWDTLGWKDVLSSPEWTRRQRAYTKAWGGSGMYTPDVVLNGQDWPGWQGARSVPAGSGKPGRLQVHRDGDGFLVVFRPAPARRGGTGWVAHAALLGMGIETDVGAGENRGERLRHDFAALAHASQAMQGQKGTFTAPLRIPEPSSPVAAPRALAAWVTRGDDPAPVQATGGFLTVRK